MKWTIKAILARVSGDNVAAFNYCMGIAYDAWQAKNYGLRGEYLSLALIFARREAQL